MNTVDTGLHRLDGRLVWTGFRELVPLSIFVVAFGAAFGLAATQAGIGELAVVVMSTLVFSGYAQFAALELWGQQVPVITMLVTVLVISARHLLMGATLYPWLRELPPVKRYGVMLVASDANWAMSLQAFGRGQPGFGLLLGGGLALWLFWVLGTLLGVCSGGVVRDPRSWGLDMVMGCFLLAVLVSGKNNWRMLVNWSVAACASLLAFRYLPENSHVITGAVAGGVAGIFGREKIDEH